MQINLWSSIPVLWLDVVCKSLWFALVWVDVALIGVCVVVIVSVAIILWTNILHLDDVSALAASTDRAVAGNYEPFLGV